MTLETSTIQHSHDKEVRLRHHEAVEGIDETNIHQGNENDLKNSGKEEKKDRTRVLPGDNLRAADCLDRRGMGEDCRPTHSPLAHEIKQLFLLGILNDNALQ